MKHANQTTVRVRFAPGTIFHERFGPYTPPVATRNFATVNDDENIDGETNETDETDGGWLERVAGVGAVVAHGTWRTAANGAISARSSVDSDRGDRFHPVISAERSMPPTKHGAKRHRKLETEDVINGITKPAIRRIARRGGVKRISGQVYRETRNVLKHFLNQVIDDAITYTEHARRKTCTAMDVVYALKRQGRQLYGFGG